MNIKTYHYTSLSNWENIKMFGFKPYLIQKPEIESYFPGGVNGIWLWMNKPEGASHAGCILWQLSTKNEETIVQLEVTIDRDDLLEFNACPVLLFHNGYIGQYLYHSGEKAGIHIRDIPPKKIKLLKTFNVVDLLK